MGQYAIRRILLFIPTLLLATVMVFALQLRQTLGLDRPLYVQYASWLWR
jgi:ABC-type dipeptide/oligopeptide/nickel transport system permease component